MRFGISLPQTVEGEGFDPTGLRGYCRLVEELGFDSAWTREGVLSPAATLSPLEVMAFAAATTRRIRLGCSVLVSTLRSPVHLAASIATLDHLSSGRVELGLGVGSRQRPFAAFGLSDDRFVTRFAEGIALMRALWTDDLVTFVGEFSRLQDATAEPKPRQKPHPPLWIGAGSAGALRRTVQLGAGFFGGGAATADAFASQVRTLRLFITEAGHDPGRWPVAKRVYVVVDEDVDRARSQALAGLAATYGPGGPVPVEAIIAGPADACAEQVARVIAAGAHLVLFHVLSDPVEQAHRVAEQVLPLLG